MMTNYRLGILAAVVTFADVATPLILPWYGYDMSRSLALMAVMFLSEALIPGIVGIWLTSHLAKMSITQLLQIGFLSRSMILVGLLSIFFLKETSMMWIILVLGAGLNGLSSVLSEAAIQSALPGKGTELTKQASHLQRVITIVRLVGAPLGGLLIGVFGPFVTLLMLAISSGFTGLATRYWLPTSRSAVIVSEANSHTDFVQGFKMLWKIPIIRSLAIQAMVGNLGYTLVMSGFLFYLLNTLRLNSHDVAAVFLVIGVGSVAGTTVISPLLSRFRRGEIYPVLYSLSALSWS